MSRIWRRRASRAMALAFLASAAVASIVRADTYTWTGQGKTSNWDELLPDQSGYANWSPASTNIPGMDDDIIFGQNLSSGNPNLNGNRNIYSLTIDSSTSYSFVGTAGNDQLGIYSGSMTRTAASSGTQTFDVPVLLGGLLQYPITFALDGTGNVVFSDGIIIQLDVQTTKSGSADMILTGAPSTIDTQFTVAGGNFIVDGTTLNDTSTGNFQIESPGSSIILKNGGTLNSFGTLKASGSNVMVTGTGSSLIASNVVIGAAGTSTLNVMSGGVVSGTNLYIGQDDGGNGVVNLQSGNSIFSAINLAMRDHSAGTLNISGWQTRATAFQVNLNGNQWDDWSHPNPFGPLITNPNGVSIVNIGAGATLETNHLSLFETNAAVNVDGGTLIIDNAVYSNGGTTINLKSDPAGGHALVIHGSGSGLFGSITGPGSVLFDGVFPLGAAEVVAGQNTYTGPTIIHTSDVHITYGSDNSSLYDVQADSILGLGEFTQPTMNLGFGTILSEPGGEVDYRMVTLNGGLIRGTGKNIITGSDSVVFNGTAIGADATVSTVAGTGTPTFNQVTVGGNLLLNSPLNLNASTIAPSGIVNVNSGSNVTAALLTSNGTLSIHSGGSITNTAANLTLGSGSITTLDNGGALTLANATALDVRGGLLTNNGNITGPVNVYFGSLAKGAGTYGGALNVFEGGRVSPGNSPGTLTSTASAWNDGGIYHWEIADLSGPAGTAWDLWNSGTTSVTPTGSFEIEIQSLGSLPGGGLQGWNSSQPYSWLIATADNGAFSATSLSHLAIVDDGFADTNSLADGSFSLTDSPDGNNLYLTFSPAPEPASFACIALFASGMLLWRKRA